VSEQLPIREPRLVEPRIRVFIDDSPTPIAEHVPPAEVSLDTKLLTDGEHIVRIEARDRRGDVGVRRVPLVVRNGPGITISGIRDGGVVHGTVEFAVNAFGSEEPFEPHRAESRAPVPVWVWVLTLVIVAWAAWYFATLWSPPAEYAKMPTFSQPMNPFK
jgi:hypothetical protein